MRANLCLLYVERFVCVPSPRNGFHTSILVTPARLINLMMLKRQGGTDQYTWVEWADIQKGFS